MNQDLTTKPVLADMRVEYVHHCGSDLTTVNAARVSFAKESTELTEKDIKLITFLAREHHTSPFNHAFITFKVRCPIFVARQLVKHEYMPWNEESRRYISANEPPTFYEFDFLRPAADDVKQGSADEPIKHNDQALSEIGHAYARAYSSYLFLLNHLGVCPEQARSVLPQGMNVNFWWSGTLGAMCEMLSKRLAPDAQKESRIVANMMAKQVLAHFPHSASAYLSSKTKPN